MWSKLCNRNCYETENFAFGKIYERNFNTPSPGLLTAAKLSPVVNWEAHSHMLILIFPLEPSSVNHSVRDYIAMDVSNMNRLFFNLHKRNYVEYDLWSLTRWFFSVLPIESWKSWFRTMRTRIKTAYITTPPLFKTDHSRSHQSHANSTQLALGGICPPGKRICARQLALVGKMWCLNLASLLSMSSICNTYSSLNISIQHRMLKFSKSAISYTYCFLPSVMFVHAGRRRAELMYQLQ